MMNKLQTNRSYFYLLLVDRIFAVLLFLFLFFGLLRIRTGISVVALFFLHQAVMLAVLCIRLSEPLKEIEEISEAVMQPERHMADLKGERPIHRLVQYVEQLMENEYTSQMLAFQAGIHALQSRVNPRFLYGTLDATRSTVTVRDSEDIAQMAESLSMLFRCNISGPNEMATLEDGLDDVESYLMIQGYRFPGKFEYQQRIEDKEPLQYKLSVPTIQPVIENAIHHGLGTKVGGGQVSVYVCSTQEYFIIRTADNGMDMMEQQMSNLRERLPKGRFIHEQGRDLEKRGNTGVALPNVNQRIKSHYGDDYRVKTYSTASIGTTVEIILPTAADSKGGES